MPGKLLNYFSVITIGVVLLCLDSGAWAVDEHAIELPVIFSQEGTSISTSACLKVRGKIYDEASAPWASFKERARTTPEKYLTETFATLVNKDEGHLRELSHPQLGRDPQRFQRQASAYFRQFASLRPAEVWGYFRFDNLLAFFVQISFKGTTGFVDFPYARLDKEGFGFLPYKTDSPVLRFTRDWFNSDWGPGKGGSPVYCSPSLLEQATHRVILVEGDRPSDSSSELLLVGVNLSDNGKKDQPSSVLTEKISALKDALSAGRMDQFFSGFTRRGRERIENWYTGAEAEDQQKYVDSFMSQEPFYAFNADPLWVVYTRTGDSGVQALYFVREKNGDFLWANAAYGSPVDRIFKSERFIKAAGREKPFGGWKIAAGSTG